MTTLEELTRKLTARGDLFRDETLRAVARQLGAQPRQLLRAAARMSFHERENSKAWRRSLLWSGFLS